MARIKITQLITRQLTIASKLAGRVLRTRLLLRRYVPYMKIAKLKIVVISVFLSNTVFACFVPDGSYEKSNYFLLAGISLLVINVFFSRSILSKYIKKSLLIVASVLAFPVYYYAINYNICCDCGHGMLLGALKSDAASGAA